MFLAASISLVLLTGACSSDSDASSPATTSASSASSEAGAPAASSTCPTATPDAAATPEWTLDGDSGSISVVGSTDTAAPAVTVDTPFSVAETQVETLTVGDGPVIADDAEVSVCYMGVNGRTGETFDSSFERGAPVDFPLGGVVAGFQKAIAGQTVGSTVAVAVTSADGYASGNPAAGIEPGDSLIFAISILSAS
ncbi:peptidylprolyl isomerase [Rhodococcus sp. 06-462-5]|uniref:FKBP-type peptidyl-prolyl cis-trans isomerase n=1 Tax=unclassified Rhodococcus (in: high G+C Gram-positive bacteria) TaxID=192944 RepID=UPI000B9A401C|nr:MULTISPECIES: FKBP-type peptidyl-prolyl cis-trans isomerase [unclassified Rhodococcus (in: high G+C Gram-positive bacteria)]OZC64241.1 peptidylprolyl isomerase [Rhodococcus sp. 06-462-5]OZE59495.1 peptidylprolyl isomerase [Rhodococcus sp. 02-925g]